MSLRSARDAWCSPERGFTRPTPRRLVRIRAQDADKLEWSDATHAKTSATRARAAPRSRPAAAEDSRRRYSRAHRPSRPPTPPPGRSRPRRMLRARAVAPERSGVVLDPQPSKQHEAAEHPIQGSSAQSQQNDAPQPNGGQSESTEQSAPKRSRRRMRARPPPQVAPANVNIVIPSTVPARRHRDTDEQLASDTETRAASARDPHRTERAKPVGQSSVKALRRPRARTRHFIRSRPILSTRSHHRNKSPGDGGRSPRRTRLASGGTQDVVNQPQSDQSRRGAGGGRAVRRLPSQSAPVCRQRLAVSERGNTTLHTRAERLGCGRDP